MRIVEWLDIEDVVSTMFAVWVNGGELEWARMAWSALQDDGLTRYSNERERHLVLIRAIDLAAAYREFCYLAWQEHDVPDYAGWAAEFDLEPFVLGQLVGDRADFDDETSDGDLVGVGVRWLCGKERFRIAACLDRRFNGPSMLFASMYATLWSPPEEEDEEDEEGPNSWTVEGILADRNALDDILNDVDEGKLAAFEWIRSRKMEPFL
ncbi:MAG: hypothetical protein IRY83_13850 [Chloroflexi bacterium]|nr:hypothetical protein [Chloroflexota bacterium]